MWLCYPFLDDFWNYQTSIYDSFRKENGARSRNIRIICGFAMLQYAKQFVIFTFWMFASDAKTLIKKKATFANILSFNKTGELCAQRLSHVGYFAGTGD
jgi:hypothetical protein